MRPASAWSSLDGRPQTQNFALAPWHAPLGRRAEGPKLRRRQGFGRIAPPAPHRPQERHVPGPAGPEAGGEDRRRVRGRVSGCRALTCPQENAQENGDSLLNIKLMHSLI